jgi:hypothetical protein
MHTDFSALALMKNWLHVWPLWAIGVAIFAGLIVLTEIGYRGALWQRRARGLTPDAAQTDAGRDFLLTAMLGLMALLLAFTFSLALSRFEARRGLVVVEANALDTAWMYAQVLREPDRAAVSSALRAYLAVRVHWSENYTGRDDRDITKQLQAKLWMVCVAAARNEPALIVSRGLTEAVSASFDAATKRLAARSAEIPDRVLHILLLYIAIAVLVLGEVAASHGNKLHRLSTWLLLLLLTLALMIILDLDRNDSGAIMVSQQPMTDLWEGLR